MLDQLEAFSPLEQLLQLDGVALELEEMSLSWEQLALEEVVVEWWEVERG